jgi:hypothetical protein
MPPTPATVRGRVIIPAGEKVNPAAGVMVTLHRVGPDAAGPLDSVRSGPDGRYSIAYTRQGSQEAVYFTAVIYRDIAYFSSPIRGLRTAEEDGEIVVFDTTTHAMPFTIQGHHIVVAAPGPDGSRKVVEVYELSNDTSVTVVGKDSLAAVWSATLPRGATAFAGGQGDVAASSLVAHAGRVEMRAPFGPGIKQLSYSYSLPAGAFPLQLTVDRFTAVLEVLLEEEGAQARAASLRAQANATTQGRSFKRFLAQGTPPGETIRIDVPVVAASTRTRVLIGLGIVIALAMIASLARALLRRSGRATARGVAPAERPSESLIAAIAALDARREAGDASLTAEGYSSERARLKAALAATMSEEQGR